MIEHGIEVPPLNNNARKLEYDELYELMVGDSVLFTGPHDLIVGDEAIRPPPKVFAASCPVAA